MGFDVPTARWPKGTPNIVQILQAAGDNTPGDGSTMRQGQKAVRIVFPGADFLFGRLSDDEFHDAVRNGATIGFSVDCGKLPRYLKNFVGQGYDGGHYMSVDGAYDDGSDDLFDPMYRPSKEAKPRRVNFGDFAKAIARDRHGDIIVTMGYENVAVLRQQQSNLTAQQSGLQTSVSQLEQRLADVATQLSTVNAQLVGKVAA
ncbi:MAG TPA: hypothetical protein VFJ93_07805 [Gaiellaceae bacterium]|nr:hypothetical protein [Gaiellaceae bacterium]